MRTSKPIILLALGTLAIPTLSWAGPMGPNVKFITSTLEIHPEADHQVSQETRTVAQDGDVEVQQSGVQYSVSVTFGSEQKFIVLPTKDEAQLLAGILKGPESVSLIVHAPAKNNTYQLADVEIQVRHRNADAHQENLEPLEQYLASNAPNDQVASQLSELKPMTGTTESSQTDGSSDGSDQSKPVSVDFVTQADANDKTPSVHSGVFVGH